MTWSWKKEHRSEKRIIRDTTQIAKNALFLSMVYAFQSYFPVFFVNVFIVGIWYAIMNISRVDMKIQLFTVYWKLHSISGYVRSYLSPAFYYKPVSYRSVLKGKGCASNVHSPVQFISMYFYVD